MTLRASVLQFIEHFSCLPNAHVRCQSISYRKVEAQPWRIGRDSRRGVNNGGAGRFVSIVAGGQDLAGQEKDENQPSKEGRQRSTLHGDDWQLLRCRWPLSIADFQSSLQVCLLLMRLLTCD